MIRKSAGSTTPGGTVGGPPGRKPPLQLKGRIFINNVTHAIATSKPSELLNDSMQSLQILITGILDAYLLQVTWRGDAVEESFGIRCRTPDQLNQWQKAVTKAVEDAQAQRRSRNVGQLSARRLASPHSQFPNTPQCELVPMPTGSALSLGSSASYAPSNPYGGTFDDEGDDGYNGDYEPSTGRSTPSLVGDRSSTNRRPATQSMPVGSRQERGEPGRPRAQTEDSNSAVIHQWRSQTPNGGFPAMPSLPRQSSGASSLADQSMLRLSTGRNGPRQQQNSEWNTTSPFTPSSSSSSTAMSSTAQFATNPSGRTLVQKTDDMSLASDPLRMLRQNSQGSLPPQAAPPPMRSRSASSPNVYQLNPAQAASLSRDNQWSPYPVQSVHPSHFAGGVQTLQSALPLKRSNGANASTATIESAGSSTTNPPKRLSSSSTGTDHSSGDSSQSPGPAYASPSSPTSQNPLGGGSAPARLGHSRISTPQAPPSPSSAVKIKVFYGEDTFVIVARSSVTYHELVEKVVRKIYLCGARTGLDASSLRLRYVDEEGDKILMSADDDVAMAFDWLRSGGPDQNKALVLYAE